MIDVKLIKIVDHMDRFLFLSLCHRILVYTFSNRNPRSPIMASPTSGDIRISG